MSQPGLPHDAVFYPSSDGQPMAETSIHGDCMMYVTYALRRYFRKRGRDDVYIGMNNFLYYEQGNPRAVVAPDVYVVPGAPVRQRWSGRLRSRPAEPGRTGAFWCFWTRTTIVLRSSPPACCTVPGRAGRIVPYVSSWPRRSTSPGSWPLLPRSRGIGASTKPPPPRDSEAIRDAKGWLSACMPPGRRYRETLHQAALTARFDLDSARAARRRHLPQVLAVDGLIEARRPPSAASCHSPPM